MVQNCFSLLKYSNTNSDFRPPAVHSCLPVSPLAALAGAQAFESTQCRTESFEIFIVASILAFCFARFPGAALAGPQAFESTQCRTESFDFFIDVASLLANVVAAEKHTSWR